MMPGPAGNRLDGQWAFGSYSGAIHSDADGLSDPGLMALQNSVNRLEVLTAIKSEEQPAESQFHSLTMQSDSESASPTTYSPHSRQLNVASNSTQLAANTSSVRRSGRVKTPKDLGPFVTWVEAKKLRSQAMIAIQEPRSAPGPKPKPANLQTVNPTKPGPDFDRVFLHFFAGDENLGAIPSAFKDCKTVDSFFVVASTSMEILCCNWSESRALALSVMVDGSDWPMILPWRYESGFNVLLFTLESLCLKKRNGTINVKAKCIMKE